MRKSFMTLLCLMNGIFFLISCQAQESSNFLSTSTSIPAFTHALLPTATLTATVTPVPSPTVTFPAPQSFQETLSSGIEMRFGLGGFGRPTLSPDGNYLAVTSGVGIILYRPETLTEIGILPQEDYVGAMAWAPDSKRLAAVSSLESITIWDVEKARPIQTLSALDVSCLAWSPDGKKLAMVKDGQVVEVWDLKLAKPVQSFTGHAAMLNQWGKIIEVLWINANEIVSLDNNAQLVRWEAHTGKIVYTWEKRKEDYSRRIALSPDKKILAIASIQSEEFILWDLVTQKEQKTIPALPPFIVDITWSPDGRSIALITQFPSKLVFLDANNGIVQKEFSTNVYSVGKLSWLKSGKEVITINADDGGIITVWDIQTGSGIHSIRSLGANHAAWSLDGKTIVTSGWGNMVLWDVQTGTPRLLPGEIRNGVLDGGPNYVGTFRIALNPSGNLLAAELGDDSSLIRVWNTVTGELFKETWMGEHLDDLFWGSDTQLIGRTLGNDVLIWDVPNLENPQRIELSPFEADFLDLSPDGTLVAMLREDIVEIRKLEGGEIFRTWQANPEHIFNLDWSPDGTKIVLVDTEKFTVYEAGTGKKINTLEYDFRSGYGGLKWSPDSAAIVYLTWKPDNPQSSLDRMYGTGNIYLWHIAAPVARLVGTRKTFYLTSDQLCLSPDGKHLALALWHKGLIVLRLP